MTVGLISGSVSNQDWYAYCAAKDLKVENRMYQTNALLLSALELGEVDAISVFGMLPHATLRIIAESAPNDFYFVGAADHAELLSQLDNVVEQIKVRDPFLSFACQNAIMRLPPANSRFSLRESLLTLKLSGM